MTTLFVNRRREKLLNAIAYFTRNTRRCHTLKLFKLLNFLDFEHYRQTGRSVTGLSYQALPKGPVPGELLNEIQQKSGKETSDLMVKETFDDVSGEVIRRDFEVLKDFDETYFTPRELKIMERLVFIFGEAGSDDMIVHSHDPKLPWKKIYGKGEGNGCSIPYELALEATPVVNDEPAIAEEDALMLKEVFQGTGLR